MAAIVAVAVLALGGFYVASRQEPTPAAAAEPATARSDAYVPSPPIPPAAPPQGQPARPQEPTAAKPETSASPVSAAPPSTPAPVDGPQLSPWKDDPSSRHATVPAPSRIEEGWFELKTSMPTLPTVRCDYRIPLGPNGRPLATAADIALLFPYPTEKAAISGLAKPLTDKHGFTTVSIRFPGMGNNDPVRPDLRSEFYYFPESGAGDAWIRAVEKVRSIGSLPKRPVFVTGRSGGGSAAALFAEANPGMVAAVANEAGKILPETYAFKGPILISYGAHDYVAPNIERYLFTAKLMGADVDSYTYPPGWSGRGQNPIWQHPIHGAAEKAMWQWLIDVADMRLDKGAIPPSRDWPARDGGRTWSSTAFRELVGKVIRPAKRSAVEGVNVFSCSPAGSDDEQRPVIAVFGSRRSLDYDNPSLCAEYFADRGHWAFCVPQQDVPAGIKALAALLRKPGFAQLRSRRWVFAIDGRLSAAADLAAAPASPYAVVLTGSAGVPADAAKLGSYSFLDAEEPLAEIRKACADKRVPFDGRVLNPKNLEQWHVQYWAAIYDVANRKAAPEKPSSR